jgi:Uri superfamily endonuclease
MPRRTRHKRAATGMTTHPATGVRFVPDLADWPDSGVYQVWVELAADQRCRVGALGDFVFPCGTYVYTGRAARGLRARVFRHAAGGAVLRWHIDYLLRLANRRIVEIVLTSRNPDDECAVNQAVSRGSICPAPGFGASDCRHGCPAHLWQVRRSKKTSAGM